MVQPASKKHKAAGSYASGSAGGYPFIHADAVAVVGFIQESET
ncbi:MAG: hypothetical protein R3B95_20760 [Nitrospirales bacterium]